MTKYNNETMCPASSTARIIDDTDLNLLKQMAEVLLKEHKEYVAEADWQFQKQNAEALLRKLKDFIDLEPIEYTDKFTGDNSPHQGLTSLLETTTTDSDFKRTDIDNFIGINTPNIDLVDPNFDLNNIKIEFDIYRGQNTETFHSDCLATGKVIICAYGYMKDQDTLRDLYSYDDYNI
ncbi:MAG: hypothetical protein WBJ81_00940 [Rickettsiales bacterium]